MTFHADAIYEGGVLRPLSPLDLNEHEVVSLSISTASGKAAAPSEPRDQREQQPLGDEELLIAARARMQELFRTVKGFRAAPKIPREELYERGSIR